MRDFLRTAEQYVVPLLMMCTGIGAINFFNRATGLETQPKEMLIGGICLFLAGVLMTPIVNQFLKKGMSLILSIVLIVGAISLGYAVYDVIVSENDHRGAKEMNDANTVQRLKDLRLAEEQYRLYNSVYTYSFDTLLTFLDEEVIPVPYRNGNVLEDKFFQANPDEMERRNEYIISVADLAEMGMTEEEALSKHYEIRDTSYISVNTKYFSDKARARRKLDPVDISKLPFNPHSGERFIIDYRIESVDNTALGVKPDVYVRFVDPTPYKIDQGDRVKKDTLSFGSLETLTLDGNWRE